MNTLQTIVKRNNVTIHGNGPQTMLMAHGFGCDQSLWHHLVDAFRDDFRIVLFDYVGSGNSDKRAYDERRYGSLDGYVDDLLDVIDALALDDVVFVGHSVISMIGGLASLRQPTRFSDLVMIAPSPRYLNDPPIYAGGFEVDDVHALLNMMEHNYAGWAAYLAPVAMKHTDQPHLSAQLEQQFCAMDPYIARRFAEVTFMSDNRAVLDQIHVPALLLQCSDDAIAPVEIGNYLHRHIPQSTLRVMNATGHCPHVSEPEETVQLIRDYLDSAAIVRQ